MQAESRIISARLEEKTRKVGSFTKSRTKQTLLDSKAHLLFAVMDFSVRSCGAALTEGLRKCEAPSRTESLALLTPCFRKVVKIW